MENIFNNFIAAFKLNLLASNRWLQLLEGLGVTMQITILSIIIGTILGVVLAFMKMSKNKILSTISKVYIDIIRGTPMVVQLLIFYFAVFKDPMFSKIFVAVFAFGLNSAAYIAEIVRAGVLAVDHGQIEAGRSLGLSSFKTLVYIVMPQAIKNVLPTYISEFIVLIKETAIVGYIALNDLTKVGDTIRSRTFDAFFPLITVAIIYFVITSVLSKLLGIVERRLRRGDIR